MALIDDVKKTLRVSNTAHDTEISDLIDAAKKDLEVAGLDETLVVETNFAIKHAIILYCKAFFGYDNSDAERLFESYEKAKIQLVLDVNNVVA